MGSEIHLTTQQLIDDALLKEQELRKDRVGSGKWKPSMFGACYRRQWYSKIGEPETDPSDARGLRIFKVGHLFHNFVQSFFKVEQTEVLIETEKVKGYADIVTEKEVVDIKSSNSNAFWYMLKNILVTTKCGKEIRVEEGAISNDKVRYMKKELDIASKRTLSILDEKINNWLQVGYYAQMLNKEHARLVFVSKDDLCIQEYAIHIDVLKPLVDKELEQLYNTNTLPSGNPRLYDGKECEYCAWKTKCEQTNKETK